MPKLVTTETFIERSKKIHGDKKYDYSLVVYENSMKAVSIICPQHSVFEQSPNHHLKGYGCPECGIIKNANNRRYTQDEIIEAAKNIHPGKYNYFKVKFEDLHTPVTIVCPKHFDFMQAMNNHVNLKQGCSKCANEQMSINRTGKSMKQQTLDKKTKS